jgi:quercetin dioxygenase-like cupin family protein
MSATRLNADFTTRVAVHAAALPWKPSPIPGVERRMLDRIGGEVARATSIVRYAPGSSFSPHVHGGGEEFLVLEGVFKDEDGEYPAGSYVRNPPQSRHTPGSRPGCTMLVKLWQFDPEDRVQMRLDTASMSTIEASGRAGVWLIPLFKDDNEEVRLEHWDKDARIELDPKGGLELLVLEGGFREAGESFKPQSWLRLPVGTPLRARTGAAGCRVWVKEGHLRHVRAPAHV